LSKPGKFLDSVSCGFSTELNDGSCLAHRDGHLSWAVDLDVYDDVVLIRRDADTSFSSLFEALHNAIVKPKVATRDV
jgi:hypothetical protein